MNTATIPGARGFKCNKANDNFLHNTITPRYWTSCSKLRTAVIPLFIKSGIAIVPLPGSPGAVGSVLLYVVSRAEIRLSALSPELNLDQFGHGYSAGLITLFPH